MILNTFIINLNILRIHLLYDIIYLSGKLIYTPT